MALTMFVNYICFFVCLFFVIHINVPSYSATLQTTHNSTRSWSTSVKYFRDHIFDFFVIVHTVSVQQLSTKCLKLVLLKLHFMSLTLLQTLYYQDRVIKYLLQFYIFDKSAFCNVFHFCNSLGVKYYHIHINT